jgi:hypothetical protein
MSFSRFMKPTTVNILYTGQHENMSPAKLLLGANQDKILYLDDDGNLQWQGFNGANLALRLDGSGKIDQQYLPSYVDDVQEYTSLANFPVTGESGKIYLDTSGVNKAYRWAGSSYFLITDLSNFFNKSEVNTLINNENMERELADANLQDDIDTEITNRTNGDNALSGRITTLETFKTAGDTNFNLSHGTNFIILRPLDMNNKAITNCPTITTINTNASTEITNRTNGDNALSGRITTLETFKTYSDLNFSLADPTNFIIIKPLDMNDKTISNCPTITGINNSITAEITNRTNADSSLQSQINTINTNAFMKNATGTQTINSSIDCNSGSVTNSNIMQCGSLRTGSINAQTGTYISSVTSVGLEFNYGKNIVLDANRSGRETNSCTISANYVDALNSLVIIGKGDTADTRRVYLEDLAYVRLDLTVPKLNSKTCDGTKRLVDPVIYSATATVPGTGFNAFTYTAPAGYQIYSATWLIGSTIVTGASVEIATDGTFARINDINMTFGATIRCRILLCQN